MKCLQCDKVALSGNIEDWDKYICPDCTKGIIQRLQWVIENPSVCPMPQYACPHEMEATRGVKHTQCLLHWVKTGRYIEPVEVKHEG